MGHLSSERSESLLNLEDMDNRLARLEESVVSLLELLKQILSLSGNRPRNLKRTRLK